MTSVKPHIDKLRFVKYFPEQNHIHPSIIYSFYYWDVNDDKSYAKYKKLMSVNFDGLLERFNTEEFLKFTPVKQVSKERNLNIYNTI